MLCYVVCLFVCLWFLIRSHREFSTHMEPSPLPLKGCLPILGNHRHWALLNVSLACHTYCDTGIRLSWSSPRIRNTHNYCQAFGSGAATTCFYDLKLTQKFNVGACVFICRRRLSSSIPKMSQFSNISNPSFSSRR